MEHGCGSSASCATFPSQQPGNVVEKVCILGSKLCPCSLLGLMKKNSNMLCFGCHGSKLKSTILESVYEVSRTRRCGRGRNPVAFVEAFLL